MKKPAIWNRLTRQLRSRGVKGASNVAKGVLKKHGLLTANGKLTAKGRKRNWMTPAQRARSRASRASGGRRKPSAYSYYPRTNKTRLKSK